MKTRDYGLDIFRIICCVGVLIYHIFDDVLAFGGETIYFLASFCVPGFFLLSGYLLASKSQLTIEYCEQKIKETIFKLLRWIIFLSVIHYIFYGEIYDIWDNLMAGINAQGLLPVSWFLFTYVFLMIVAYPLYNFKMKSPLFFNLLSVSWAVLLAFGVGRSLIAYKPQSLWLHLYMGYFTIGMSCKDLKCVLDKYLKKKLQCCLLFIFNIIGLTAYVFSVKSEEVFLFPHNYYGKWFYTLWLISLFLLIILININSVFYRKILEILSQNTVVVYLGHLPILTFFTNKYPVINIVTAVLYVLMLFIVLEIIAEIFKRIPFLRTLI